MGNCECNNPEDIGYEINANDKEEKSNSNNRYNQDKANISGNEKKNLEIIESNDYQSNRKKQILNTDNISKTNEYNIYNSQRDQIQQNNEWKREGSDSLRARYESQSKNSNNYNNNCNYEQNPYLLNNEDKPIDYFSRYIFYFRYRIFFKCW
jgi:hypothetical protein